MGSRRTNTMKQTPTERKIADIAGPCLAGLGFRLVAARLGDFDGAHTLRILAENAQGTLTLDECTAISRTLGPLLEVEDPIPGAYRLEVSSPGIDRPLVAPEDYARFAGHEAKIELDAPLDGQKRFRGIVRGCSGGTVTLETDQGDKALPFDRIEKARLVLTDALLGRAPAGKKQEKPRKPRSTGKA